MWACLIVVMAPAFQLLPYVRQVQEHLAIQAFVPESSVEAFDIAVLNRATGPDEVQLDTRLMRPYIHRLPREFAAVIGGNGFRHTTQNGETLHMPYYFFACLRAIRIDAQALPRVLIDYRQDAEPTTVRQSIAHKIHTPSLIRPRRLRQRDARVRGSFPTLLRSHLQTFFAI